VVVLTHDQNQGKGAALRTGFQRACGDIVVIQDADLEYDPQDILQVIEPLQRRLADAVYGSRYLETPLQDPSWIHRFGNGCLTKFSNWMTGQRLTDMETCYKAFRREVLQRIQIEQSRFGFEPEITAKLSRLGIKIKEVNVRYHSRSRKDGKKIGWRDAINAIACIIRYRRDNG
jgi:glycosyltransferase involved in cell wall biosynthesis